jgi:hypothetical protein
MDMKQFEPKESSNKYGNVIFMVVCLFIVVAFERFMNFILKPLSKETRETDNLPGIIEAKQEAREAYLERIAEDANDPMFQFQARFIEDPKSYQGDPDNKIYKAWYENWKKGEVLDSNLRWVPEVYDGDSFTPEFLEYMKIQYALHKKASWIDKTKFLNTIRQFYPEFSASFKGMAQDLARYSDMVNDETLQGELQEELKKYGLSEELADYLAKKDLSVKELQRQAEYLKSCAERGYEISASICALENGCALEEVKVINMVVRESDLPAAVGLAYLREEITVEEVKELIGTLSIFDRSDYDEIIADELKTYRSKKRALKYA